MESELLRAGRGVVPMPVPDFVRAGKGKCRAVLTHNPHFGSLSIWSVALGDENGPWNSNFWYWFNPQDCGVIFSLAPPHSLTMIDYQTIVRDAVIDPHILESPCAQLPTCEDHRMIMVQNRPTFMPAA